jgi:hypothetical protein
LPLAQIALKYNILACDMNPNLGVAGFLKDFYKRRRLITIQLQLEEQKEEAIK